ncbi:type II toxin-antitoxin system VapC family toxin [Gracilibacillus phocaeensis]|uniref:type II toxin-antitoxin system VapC family toxin n=1 Tax=Gracilibacillus phocaeensis TaxID=2042304 RepID=UPI00102FCCAE|nr:PIN domain-containing protein [Gracilibacillus phocaeensis]
MKRSKLFIDTGAWIALMSTSDQHHKKARHFFEQLDFSITRITSSCVIAETYTWLRYREGAIYAQRFLDIINHSKANRALDVIDVDTDTRELAEQILLDLADQRLSYTDAVNLAIMKKEQIHQVFGFDQSFYHTEMEIVP